MITMAESAHARLSTGSIFTPDFTLRMHGNKPSSA
jgi:hypothetical protein